MPQIGGSNQVVPMKKSPETLDLSQLLTAPVHITGGEKPSKSPNRNLNESKLMNPRANVDDPYFY